MSLLSPLFPPRTDPEERYLSLAQEQFRKRQTPPLSLFPSTTKDSEINSHASCTSSGARQQQSYNPKDTKGLPSSKGSKHFKQWFPVPYGILHFSARHLQAEMLLVLTAGPSPAV